MKREVKAGLLVAAVVCGIAAILLGGGVLSRSRPPTAELRLGGEDAPARPVISTSATVREGAGAAGSSFDSEPAEDALATDEDAGSLVSDIAGDIMPPSETDTEALGETFSLDDDAIARAGAEAGAEAGDELAAPDELPPGRGVPPRGGVPPAAETGWEDASAEDTSTEAVETVTEASGTDSGPPAEDWTAADEELLPADEEPAVAVTDDEKYPDADTEEVAYRASGRDEQDDEGGAGGFDPPLLAVDHRPRPPVAPPANLVAAPRAARFRYRVKDGESFWTISKKLFGKGEHYVEIVHANPDLAPKELRAGRVIAIPELPGAPVNEEHLAAGDDPLGPRPAEPKVYLERDVTHVVKSGEMLGDIARKHYGAAIKWPHILKANPGLSPKRLRADARIVVPALTERPGWPRALAGLVEDADRDVPPPRAPRVYLAEAKTHKVGYGDTLQKILRDYYGAWSKWPHIVKANPDIDPERLKPGQEITVPALTE